jgi:hypothetical protein
MTRYERSRSLSPYWKQPLRLQNAVAHKMHIYRLNKGQLPYAAN